MSILLIFGNNKCNGKSVRIFLVGDAILYRKIASGRGQGGGSLRSSTSGAYICVGP